MRIITKAALLSTLLLGCSDTGTAPVAPPQFISYGTPTGSSFGAVGAMLYDFPPSGITGDDQWCTGTLISPTVFLVAAHCVAFFPAGSQLYVSFDDTLQPVPSGLIPVTEYHFDPRFGRDYGNLYDVAVLLLPAGSTNGITPLSLPPEGYLDQLAASGGLAGTMFINVGYGKAANTIGQPALTYDGVRKSSESRFEALTLNSLALLMNPNATNEGGICHGDSGSPKFLASNPNMVLTVAVRGDRPCRAIQWNWRLDIPESREFLTQYVTVP